MGRAAALVLVAGLSGCGGFERLPVDTGDGGTCEPPAAEPITCTRTKARGFEPLGDASMESIRAALAPAGSKTMAVWEVAGAHAGDPGKVYGALIDFKGAVGNTVLLADGGSSPQLVRAGDVLNLFWLQDGAVMRQQLSDEGMLLNQPQTVLTGTADYFALAWTGKEFGLLLQGANGDPYQVYWLRLDETGNILDGPRKLTTGSINSLQPALAWTGCLYAAAWTDTRMGTPAVYAALFDPTFARRTEDLQISGDGVRGSFPAVAAQPTGGVVVCHEQLVAPGNQEIFCSRMDLTGTLTSTQVNLSNTSTPSQNPWVTAHGKNVWVLWDDYLASPTVPGVVWNFLDENGAPLNPDTTVDPDIAAGGWRATGYTTSDALYFVQYFGDNAGAQFTAQVVTENCF